MSDLADHDARRHEPCPVDLYCRVSDETQTLGGGMDRQVRVVDDGIVARFCEIHNGYYTGRLLRDDGLSAFKGEHLDPDAEFGRYLEEMDRGLIRGPRILAMEHPDRLNRAGPDQGGAIRKRFDRAGVRIGFLHNMTVRDPDPGNMGARVMETVDDATSFIESQKKQRRNRAEWAAKRQAARERQVPLTARCPAWLRIVGALPRLTPRQKCRDIYAQARYEVVPEREETLHLIFRLSANGLGTCLIVQELIRRGIPAWTTPGPRVRRRGALKGRQDVCGGKWSRSTVGILLSDRRVLGEYQPRTSDGRPDGPPIAGYYPGVIGQAEWDLAQAGKRQRTGRPGRRGKRDNVWSHLLYDAQTGTTYVRYASTDSRKRSPLPDRILCNEARQGRAPCRTFPFLVLQESLFSFLRELDHRQVLDRQEPDATRLLEARVDELRDRAAGLQAELRKADRLSQPFIAAALAPVAAELAEATTALDRERERAATPTSRAWEDWESLAGQIESLDALQVKRLQLCLRRMIDRVTLLIVRRGSVQLVAVQIDFVEGGRRLYLIYHRPRRAGACRREPELRAASFSSALGGVLPDVDLREAPDVSLLEATLRGCDHEELRALLHLLPYPTGAAT
jgi:DNA invertase Pin-like site-specific DNA recombinase